MNQFEQIQKPAGEIKAAARLILEKPANGKK